MLFIKRENRDPYINIATEEYVLKEIEEDTFMIWRNDPSIIIGKHQNASGEINHAFVEQHNLPVIRRITGGGTVYHDPGNINYSFTSRGDRTKLIDFKKHTRPILNFMKETGINASFEGKSNLCIDGLKFSGNAAHVYKDKVLHHGTLLFSANLNMLEEAIQTYEERYVDKSVRSIRSRVTNISDHLPYPMTVEDFMQKIFTFMIGYFDITQPYEFTQKDLRRIQKLAAEKYQRKDWNFGYSPKYEFKNKLYYNDKCINIQIFAKDGLIIKAVIENAEGMRYYHIENILTDLQHIKLIIRNELKIHTFEDDTENYLSEHLADHLF